MENTIAILHEMLDTLERENTALRSGDAACISELAAKKLKLAEGLDAHKDEQVEIRAELKALGRQVRDLANINHSLLNQMNQHYTGMLSMMMRLSGESQTYASSGYMGVSKNPVRRRREIIA